MSIAASGSSLSGSGGTGVVSGTGSGGAGGRRAPVASPPAGGGGIGRATGGFFLAHAPTPSASAITAITAYVVCVILSSLLSIVYLLV